MVRFARFMLIAALMISIGAQWVVLQSAAWVGMAVSYSVKAGSVSEGLSKTFDGAHPCPMCKLVAKGKASEKKDAKVDAKQKIELFSQTSVPLVFSPPFVQKKFPLAASESAPSRITSPAVPPPRCGVA